MQRRTEGVRMLALACAECSPSSAAEMLSSSGTGEANANGEEVRPIRGRKSKMRHSSVKLEAPPSSSAKVR
jgi:putative transposase